MLRRSVRKVVQRRQEAREAYQRSSKGYIHARVCGLILSSLISA